MNIDQIRYFLEVSRTKNFTEAAKSLYISQPSLSKSIQLLEEEIGVKLLDRGKRRIEMTEAGMLFQRDFTRILNEMELTLNKVRDAGIIQKEIRIGIFQPLATDGFFNDVMNKINRLCPDYKVTIQLLKFHEMIRAYELEEVNLLFCLSIFHMYFENCEFYPVKKIQRGIIYGGQKKQDLDSFQGKKLVTLKESFVPEVKTEQLQTIKRLGIIPAQIVETGDMHYIYCTMHILFFILIWT